jgi:tetratricopeptide (TPR) repeat protein
MAYQGNPELSVEAQERVMSSFRQVVLNLQQGQREEAMIGLEFVLRIDPAFTPAVGLQHQLRSGSDEIDLTDIVAQLEAPITDAINEMLVEAVEAFSQRNFVDAKAIVEKVLIELPGHPEARQLLGQVNESLKVEQQVGQFLAQAREALASGDPQEAANFVMMAQALDPHHTGIAATLQEIHAAGGRGEGDSPAPPGSPFEDAPEPPPTGGGFDGGVAADAGWSPGDVQDLSFDAEVPPPETGFDDLEISEPRDTGGAPPASEGLTEEIDAGLFDTDPTDSEAPADDVSDLFDAEPEVPAAGEGAGAAQELVERGSQAFQAGSFLEAIDAWSRVYLSDPANTEVGKLIDEAKKQIEESRRQAEHLLFDAEDAVISGDKEKALELVERVLAEYPGHPEATELQQRLKGIGVATKPAHPEPAASALPELEDDLFSEPFEQPETVTEADAEPAVTFDDELAEFLPDEGPRRRTGLAAVPWRTVALGGGGLAVLVVGWLVISSLLGGGSGGASGDVYAMKAEAEALFAEGKVGAALSRVEQFEPGDEIDRQLVNMLLDKYRAALATPTPTPVPAQATEAQELMAAGLWYRAYDTALVGLESHPSDGGLLDLTEEIEMLEPRAQTLRTQLANGNYRGAVATAQDLLVTYPDQQDLDELLRRSLFNASLAELRSYNLTGESTYLNELNALDSDDPEVSRVLDFIANYKTRPVDMQLKVFIQSLKERTRWEVLEASGGPAVEPPGSTVPTPTPEPVAG